MLDTHEWLPGREVVPIPDILGQPGMEGEIVRDTPSTPAMDARCSP
jgi:hypothetical protein